MTSPRIYIVGATLPAGGAFMAYHVGRILHKLTGFELVDVQVKEAPLTAFTYDIPMQALPLAQLKATITDRDFLIANPSFSYNLFGLTVAGKKIMYAQDFRTFAFLDCQFDLYVSVSRVVQQFLSSAYQIESFIIPAFINTDKTPAGPTWQDRPAQSLLIYTKVESHEHQIIKNQIVAHIKQAHPQAIIDTLDGKKLSQAELFARMQRSRYLINLSIAEGFGLIALEAMRMGCTVLGLDGVGGQDYMKHGLNCLTVPFKDYARIPALIDQAITDETLAQTIAKQGMNDAAAFEYHAFAKRWEQTLSLFLNQHG
jgi:hypothetical protein